MDVLTCYIWYRYLSCYIWHIIPDTGICHAIFDTDTCHAIFDTEIAMLYLTPIFTMLYLTPIIAMLYLTPIFAMLYLTPTLAMLYCTPIIVMLYLTPIFVMLYLTRDIWHRHSVFTPVLSIYTDTWHVTLDILYMTLALGIYTDTLYIDPVLDICHTWHLHLTHGIWYAFMWLSCGTNTWTWHHDSWPDTTTPDTCVLYDIFMVITFTGTWLLYYYQIFGTPKLLYSCILEPLK